ncbi:MAG: lipid-A-disaccharide synthase [bacterium]|nr:lipid-A-disaccharide synthase [bacterium]
MNNPAPLVPRAGGGPRGRLLVVAGEVSGDKHAAKLIREIRRMAPGIEIHAAGGERMRAAGATLLHDLASLAVLGSVEVLRHYRELRRIFHRLLSFIERERPAAVVLVDYPGFNIRLAKRIRRRRLPVRVIYYISPQVWAWGMRRKRTIGRTVDRMIAILPFEKEFYADTAMPVDFVGHPILEDIRTDADPGEVRARWGAGAGAPVVALLPGSRWNEVRRHVPVMLGAAAVVRAGMPAAEFVMPDPPAPFREFVRRHVAACPVPVRLVPESLYDIVRASRLAIVASGTATLETACLLTPMVIIYKVAWPTYLLGRMLVRLPYIGLVNVIAGRMIMPEFIQRRATPAAVAGAALGFLLDGARHERAVEELRQVRRRVGETGASARAARVVLAELARASHAARAATPAPAAEATVT